MLFFFIIFANVVLLYKSWGSVAHLLAVERPAGALLHDDGEKQC